MADAPARKNTAHLGEGAPEWDSLALEDAPPLQTGEGRQVIRVDDHVVAVLLHQQPLDGFATAGCPVCQRAHYLSQNRN